MDHGEEVYVRALDDAEALHQPVHISRCHEDGKTKEQMIHAHLAAERDRDDLEASGQTYSYGLLRPVHEAVHVTSRDGDHVHAPHHDHDEQLKASL